MMAAQDAMLLGRVTYEMFAAHWPHQTGDLADTMNNTAKYVVSGTLKSADWQNSTLISASRAYAEIAELKQQPGQDITVGASATLVRFLLAEHLLDELRLLVHPVVAGTGTRLFAEDSGRVALTLLESRPHRNGVITLRYEPAAD